MKIGGTGDYLVPFHSQVFQLLQLAHLRGDRPKVRVVQLQPPEAGHVLHGLRKPLLL